MADRDGTADARLREIAGLLGVSIESFSAEPSPGGLADAAECLRLLGCLRTDAGRAAALDALRKILDEEPTRGPGGASSGP